MLFIFTFYWTSNCYSHMLNAICLTKNVMEMPQCFIHKKKNWKVIFQPSEKFTMDQGNIEKLSLPKEGRVSTQQINAIYQNILG